MLSIDHYTNLNLKYNPFSFLDPEKQLHATVPRFDVGVLADEIRNCESLFLEFFGKKGHGKSTHLSMLILSYLPNAEYHRLKQADRKYIKPTSNILAIDSFQLLSLKNRIELMKNQKILIYTTHLSHRSGMILRKDKTYKGFNFTTMDLELAALQKIISSKIELARLNREVSIPKVKQSYLSALYNLYKKDIRSIEAALYSEFLNPRSTCYEL